MGYEKGKVDLNNIMDIPYEVAKFLFGDDKRLNKFIVAILIVWLLILIVRTIINANQNRESTWLHRAQKRQNNKFENMNSEIIKNSQERKNQETRKVRKSRSSEWSTESIRAQYIKQHHGRRPGEPKWYSTGWTYNEDTGLWDPPDFVVKESNDRWQWDP